MLITHTRPFALTGSPKINADDTSRDILYIRTTPPAPTCAAPPPTSNDDDDDYGEAGPSPWLRVTQQLRTVNLYTA
jgi:hypothetical protein